MDTSSIFEAMVENYLRCTSYEDIGSFDQTIVYTKRTDTSKGNFSTTFIRPDLLRFEMTYEEPHYSRRLSIQSDGESFREMTTFTPEEYLPASVAAYDSFYMGLITLAGSTLGITAITFSLMGIIKSRYNFLEAATISRFDDEVIDGSNCDKLGIVIFPEDRAEATAWISKETNLLKKYQMHKIVTDEGRKERDELRSFFAPEGFEHEQDECLSLTQNFYFNEITFNNSISVDKITSPLI